MTRALHFHAICFSVCLGGAVQQYTPLWQGYWFHLRQHSHLVNSENLQSLVLSVTKAYLCTAFKTWSLFLACPKNFSVLKSHAVVKLQCTCFEKLIFKHVFNVRKSKRIAKFHGLEAGHCKDIKEIVASEINPKGFRTFEKQAPEQD